MHFVLSFEELQPAECKYTCGQTCTVLQQQNRLCIQNFQCLKSAGVPQQGMPVLSDTEVSVICIMHKCRFWLQTGGSKY